jgi:hypothetical protein
MAHGARLALSVQMAEGGVDRITAMRVAGHVTEKMWSKYSQVRIDSVREKLAEAFRLSARPMSRHDAILLPGAAQC